MNKQKHTVNIVEIECWQGSSSIPKTFLPPGDLNCHCLVSQYIYAKCSFLGPKFWSFHFGSLQTDGHHWTTKCMNLNVLFRFPWCHCVLIYLGISGPPAEPQWGSKFLELWFHKKTIKKLWIHKNVMLKNVDPQKKCEGCNLKLWIHKKWSWNFVDPQKVKLKFCGSTKVQNRKVSCFVS